MTIQDVATAYDAIAAGYDDLLEGDGWMRSVLWSRYARLFRRGEKVLDIGCGTGTDALFLAGRGVAVTGIDVSPAMVEILREKAAQPGAQASSPAPGLAGQRSVPYGQGLLDARVMDLAEIASLESGGFDGVVSAFAGLSTTPDLTPFARDAARLLRPGGRMVVHMLGRLSLWERLGALQRGGWQAARMVGAAREREFTIGGTSVRHYLYLPHDAYRRFFEPHFVLTDTFSLGCLRPPHTVRRVPLPLAKALGKLEPVLGRRRPFLNWGRFFILEMTKRGPGRTQPARDR